MKNKLTLYIAVVTLIIVMNHINSHFCGIDKIKKPQRILVKQENENGRKLLEDNWESLRIHLDFSYIENNIGRMKKQDVIDLRDRIMPKTKEIFEKLLKVKRVQNKLKLNAPTCETFPIPEIYHTEGVDADLVIFVLLDDSGYFKENGIEAAAIHCLQHQSTLRPIAGYIQFKQDLNVNDSTALDYMVWLAIHEITHILVMNEGLYDDFIDSKTLIPYGYDKIIGKYDLPSGKKMNQIQSKNVVDMAKKHFDCDSITGVPLEYNGGIGTAGAHWSKKYMNTDYMIGDSYGENLISEITLALFQDSGWYQVDYELSNLFLWGKGKGCEFVNPNKKCLEKEKGVVKSKYSEFCSKLGYPLCSISNIFRASCKGMKSSKPLNAEERYFDDPNIGGNDVLTDYCPIAYEEKGGQTYYGGSCRQGTTSTLNYSFEKICPECACFMSNLQEEKFFLRSNKQRSLTAYQEDLENANLTRDDKRASCFDFTCKDNVLYVIINDVSHKCENGEIKVDGFSGSVLCPSAEYLCNKKFKCKFGCIEKFDNSKQLVEFNS